MNATVAAWREVRDRIQAACLRSGRNPGDVRLIAVSKFFPVDAIAPLVAQGQLDFGESRAQELIQKAPLLPEEVRWHFIGALQKNKINKALPYMHMLHSLDSIELADALDARIQGRPLPALIQVNLGDEPQKAGIPLQAATALLAHVLEHCQHLKIKGLMAIPPSGGDPRPYFSKLRNLRDRLALEGGGGLTELSIGMSGDFEAAIEEGATLVRVGSTIFGHRQ